MNNKWYVSALSLAIIASSTNAFASTTDTSTKSSTIVVPNNYSVKSFANDGKATKPDDITRLGDHIFVGFQNGVGSKGEASKSGVTQSTVVEYDLTGNKINSWDLTGKCDGLTSDPVNNRLLATVNEDGNSSFNVLYPDQPSSQWVNYKFSPAPDAQGAPMDIATGGGTDAITVLNGNIYISASAPADPSHAALFLATLNDTAKTVTLKSVFKGNELATNVLNIISSNLNLTDPDANTIVPVQVPNFGGNLMVDAQADQELIFVRNPGTSSEHLNVLPIDAAVDDTVWATSKSGTLLVSDTNTNTVYAIKGAFTPGQAFVAMTDNNALGTLDLTTGKTTTFATGLNAPHGMLFIPDDSSSKTEKKK